MLFCRTITSRLSPFGSSGTEELGAGRFSSRMLVCENTAVNSRKNTRMTIMSIIGTMFRSWRPLYFAWLRMARAASLEAAMDVSLRRLPGQFRIVGVVTGSGGPRCRRTRHGRAGCRSGRLRVTLGNGVQELHHRDLQAVDECRGLRFEEHVRQQQHDGDEQARGRGV